MLAKQREELEKASLQRAEREKLQKAYEEEQARIAAEKAAMEREQAEIEKLKEQERL